MTKRSSNPTDAVLVAIDMSKHRQEVLIERPEGGRRRRMTVMVSIGVQTGPPIGAQKGPPFEYGTTVEERSLRCAWRREGGARPETRAAQSILIPVCGGDQFRFLKRQLSLPVSIMSQ